MKTLHLSLLALVLLVDPANYAATPDREGCCTTTEAAIQESGQASQASQSTKTKTEPQKKKKKSFPPRGAIVAAPLPIVSPAIGAGIIPILGYIFPFGKDDKISPPSTVGAAGLITNNGSSGYGVAAQLFMKENTYEVTSLYVHGNVNYNLYGIGTAAGNEDLKVPLDQAGQLYSVRHCVGFRGSFLSALDFGLEIPLLP